MTILLFIAIGAVAYTSQRRIKVLEQRIFELSADMATLNQELLKLRAPQAQPDRPEPEAQVEPTPPAPEEHATPVYTSSPPPAETPAAPSMPSAPIAPALSTKPQHPPYEPPPHPLAPMVKAIREFFLRGNTVVLVGTLVLLVGVVLLLKWAADQNLFPIELRMASAAAIGLALVAVGFSQRDKRPGFSQTLQGGGVAAMYLVVFFSFRTYELLPGSIAFALLAGIAFFSGALAVMQNAMPLVVIGIIGGFMAPVLASTGQGNHIALFSYYLILNLAIFGVAWFKAWRPLNLLGFLFTFGVGSTWGALRYRPEDFATTEPFLVAFFLLYLAIPILFATRERNEVRGWVDGTIVFGTPLVTLLLQSVMVRDIPFGMAFTTFGMAVIYVVAASYTFRRAPEAMRSMAEALLAIGVGFATLAIPYGFDNHNLTGATWALEGAGLYWMGVRQSRWFSRFAGATLQLLAGIALIVTLADHSATGTLPFANTRFIASLLIALGAFFVAGYAYVRREDVFSREAGLLQLLIVWGLAFWLGTGLNEISERLPEWWVPGTSLAFVGLTALALELVAGRVGWLPGRYPGALLVPLWGGIAWGMHAGGSYLLDEAGIFGWPIYVATVVVVLRRFVPQGPTGAHYLHAVFLWSLAVFTSVLFADSAIKFASLEADWIPAIYVASTASVVALSVRLAQTTRWPFEPHREVYVVQGAGLLVAGLLVVSVVWGLGLSGNTPPLPYAPIVSPVDLTIIGALLVVAQWHVALVGANYASAPEITREQFWAVLAVVSFCAFNGVLARSVHHFADVPFTASALWDSVPFQVAVSVSWTLVALGVTVDASRRGIRTPWIVGAVLLGVVVVKMFVVDLATLSTIAKIGTFLAVGVLLLLVGYLAPVPPAGAATSQTADPSEDPE